MNRIAMKCNASSPFNHRIPRRMRPPASSSSPLIFLAIAISLILAIHSSPAFAFRGFGGPHLSARLLEDSNNDIASNDNNINSNNNLNGIRDNINNRPSSNEEGGGVASHKSTLSSLADLHRRSDVDNSLNDLRSRAIERLNRGFAEFEEKKDSLERNDVVIEFWSGDGWSTDWMIEGASSTTRNVPSTFPMMYHHLGEVHQSRMQANSKSKSKSQWQSQAQRISGVSVAACPFCTASPGVSRSLCDDNPLSRPPGFDSSLSPLWAPTTIMVQVNFTRCYAALNNKVIVGNLESVLFDITAAPRLFTGVSIGDEIAVVLPGGVEAMGATERPRPPTDYESANLQQPPYPCDPARQLQTIESNCWSDPACLSIPFCPTVGPASPIDGMSRWLISGYWVGTLRLLKVDEGVNGMPQFETLPSMVTDACRYFQVEPFLTDEERATIADLVATGSVPWRTANCPSNATTSTTTTEVTSTTASTTEEVTTATTTTGETVTTATTSTTGEVVIPPRCPSDSMPVVFCIVLQNTSVNFCSGDMFTGARAQFRNATKWANLQFVTDEHATIGDVLDTTINQCVPNMVVLGDPYISVLTLDEINLLYNYVSLHGGFLFANVDIKGDTGSINELLTRFMPYSYGLSEDGIPCCQTSADPPCDSSGATSPAELQWLTLGGNQTFATRCHSGFDCCDTGIPLAVDTDLESGTQDVACIVPSGGAAFFFSDWHSFMDFATPAGFLPGLIGTDDNADILAQLLDVWINL